MTGNLNVQLDELGAVVCLLETQGVSDTYGVDPEAPPLERFLHAAKMLRKGMLDEQAAADAAGDEPSLAPPSDAGLDHGAERRTDVSPGVGRE